MGITFDLCEDCQILGRDVVYLVEFIDVSEERTASIFRAEENMFTILRGVTSQKNVIVMATTVRMSNPITLVCIGL
jgi:hypothetical protein